MKLIRFTVLPVCLLVFVFSTEAIGYIRNVDAIPKGKQFRPWIHQLVDEEKKAVGGLALQIPSELAVAQAVLESGGGTSRIARRYNNFFGLYGKDAKALRFANPRASVRCYLKNLITHKGYGDFRTALRQGVDDPIRLSKKLSKTYAKDSNYHTMVVSLLR